MGHFSVSVIGKDRPGIVASVSRILYELGCNIEDSSCTILAGQFAMILIVYHDLFNSTEEFDRAFESLINEGLTISVNAVRDEDVCHDKSFKGHSG